MRKSTSCTLCYVDQFLPTSECRGQGTVALSSVESELYALGALSAELIFAQAILKEIGLSFLIHAGADSSTARAVAILIQITLDVMRVNCDPLLSTSALKRRGVTIFL